MSQDRRIRRRVASLDNRYAHQLLSQFPVPGDTEDQLVAGLDIILDYLNHGSGAPALNYLRGRADRWTVAHHHGTAADDYYAFRDAAQGGRAVAAAAPQGVLDVHPNFFDLREISWLRLDSTPPEFVHESGSDDSSSSEDEGHEDDDDDSDGYESDTVSVQGDEFRLPPSIDDLSSNSSSSEEFPPYEEPALPPQQQQQQPEATALRLVRRCDLERETTALRLIVDRLIADSAASSYFHEQSAAAIAFAVGRRRDEVRIRAADLLDSPVLYHIPALLAHLASLPQVPTYVEQLRRHSMLVRDEQASQRVSEVRAQSRGTLLISPPPSDGGDEDDDGGLQSPVLSPCFSLPESIATTTTATTAAAAAAASSSSALKRLRNDEYNLHDRDYQEAQEYEEVPLTPSAKRCRGPWNLWGLIGR
ncbi:hypothetical protein LMH87_004424 [Akanthomyces muscarius]|uniref:Uncharacterized protein n=1 Tax=Akanthomyces muscarius TaxID=2231603 RepID=A0A9W8UH09_AKAMU|nr:hypothetical protein LMH87_004424 [Akanthomyces muscarius]KAJ4145576.1 hypothetical protein LMH87_004424 [Akanthomyces muscarius]